MMMTDLILKYLLEKSHVKIPGFGIFQQRDSPAFYDEKSAALLPPGKELFFDVNFDLKDENLAQYIVENQSMTSSESQTKIHELVSFWKSTLENKKELELPEFGNFYVNDEALVFKGKHFTTESPDNFGLEEVNLAQLKENSKSFQKPLNKDYNTSSNKLWWLLFIIPVAAIVYFASQKPELIFGKKSFQNLNKTKTIPVAKKDNFKKKILKSDSISTKK